MSESAASTSPAVASQDMEVSGSCKRAGDQGPRKSERHKLSDLYPQMQDEDFEMKIGVEAYNIVKAKKSRLTPEQRLAPITCQEVNHLADLRKTWNHVIKESQYAELCQMDLRSQLTRDTAPDIINALIQGGSFSEYWRVVVAPKIETLKANFRLRTCPGRSSHRR